MMTVKRKVLLQIPLGHQRVRSVCFVAGAGTSLPRPVGRLIVATTPPTSGATSLASAQSSSRSQLAVHSDFAFEREGSTKILVSGVEGRSAARQNVLVTTDNRKDHRRWSSDCSKMLLLSATETIPLYLHTAQPESATLRPPGSICAAANASNAPASIRTQPHFALQESAALRPSGYICAAANASNAPASIRTQPHFALQ